MLLLDKIKQPRAMQQVLQKDHPKATNPRFGTAEVNEEIDAKLVRFHLNRAAPGMARRLVRTLKGTGYGKVEIVLEDGSVAEKAGAEEDEQDAETTPGDAPTPPAAHHDAGQLTRALKALAERIAGCNRPRQTDGAGQAGRAGPGGAEGG